MKYLTVLLIWTALEVVWTEDEERTPLGSRWDKLNDFDMIYYEYSVAAQSVLAAAKNTIIDVREKSASFIDTFFNNSIEIAMAKNFSRNSCSERVFNYPSMRRSFFAYITKSEMPLLTHVTELEGKLNEIKTTIKMYHDVAESEYWSCKMSNMSCIDTINLWLDKETKSIACRLQPCQDNPRQKRRTTPCRREEFTCNDKSCIKRTWLCDGQFDCRDGSDEPAGCVKVCKDGFHCFRTQRCIDRSLICNDFNDCGDKSDELYCGKILKKNNASYCTIENGRFMCSQNKCISIHEVCDGKPDCEGGTDEGARCGKEECPDECVMSGGVCFHGPQGPLCFSECPLGTVEDREGCTARPSLYNSTVFDLLEDIPEMATRHYAKFAYIKMKTLYTFSVQLADVIKCQLGASSNK